MKQWREQKLRTTTRCNALSLLLPLTTRESRDFCKRSCYCGCNLVVLTTRPFTTWRFRFHHFAHQRGHSCCLIYMARQLIISHSTSSVWSAVFVRRISAHRISIFVPTPAPGPPHGQDISAEVSAYPEPQVGRPPPRSKQPGKTSGAYTIRVMTLHYVYTTTVSERRAVGYAIGPGEGAPLGGSWNNPSGTAGRYRGIPEGRYILRQSQPPLGSAGIPQRRPIYQDPMYPKDLLGKPGRQNLDLGHNFHRLAVEYQKQARDFGSFPRDI